MSHFDYSAHCTCKDCSRYDRQEWDEVKKAACIVAILLTLLAIYGGMQ